MSHKIMALGRDDSCATCGAPLPAGTTAVWFSTERKSRCIECAASHVDPGVTTPTLPEPQPVAEAQPSPPSAPSVAGGSAQHEYDKRSARESARKQKKVDEDAEWRQAIKEERPVLGRMAAVLTPKPTIGPESQATKAWKTGAEGERRVAEVLAEAEGVVALHDVVWPGRSKANIDHIAVGPAGIYVIDAKKYAGKVALRNVGNVFRQDWQLYVGSRNQMKLVEGVLSQAEALRSVLGDAFASVPVMPVLCFVGADWGWPMRPVTVKGVTSLWPVKLTEHVSTSGEWGHLVLALAEHLHGVLKQAGK